MTAVAIVIMMVMAFFQNVSFTIVSRSRNRNHMMYHLVAAVFSNGVWFMTMKYLVITQNMSWVLFIPYTIGTVSGSLFGQAISIRIEKWLGATA